MYYKQRTSENCISATRNLLHLLKIKVTDTTISDSLQRHPDYPSLLSISDVLCKWEIANGALKLDIDRLDEVPFPVLAHLKVQGGIFVTLKQNNNDGKIAYIDDDGSEQYFAKEEFRHLWDGVVLITEINENSGEAEYSKSLKEERLRKIKIPAIFSFFLIIGAAKIITILASSPILIGYYIISLIACSIVGIIVASLLLWHEYDSDNPILRKVCSAGIKDKHMGDQTGCQAVLASKGSKVLGNISWTEIGFIYFWGCYLYLLVTGTKSPLLIELFCFISLPYIFFSVFYQAVVAKNWCILCLTIQVIILLEFIATIFLGESPFKEVNRDDIYIMTVCLSLPLIFWIFTKPYLYEAKNTRLFQYKLTRMKGNQEIFTHLLHQQTSINQPPNDFGVTIGNPAAPNVLIKVCNPYCNPCAKAHFKIDKLLAKNPSWLIQIIFIATGKNNDIRSLPAAHLMAIGDEDDEVLKKKALDDWYGSMKKDYQAFSVKYPINGKLSSQVEKLEKMNEWCTDIGITHTPTFFVTYRCGEANKDKFTNRTFRLPSQYEIEDLIYL